MDYTIYILAEGKSSRMGQDKGLVKIKDKEMIAHCIDHLLALQKEIVIISSNLAYKKFGFRMIADKEKDQGPAQGIITALEDSQTEKNLIVSCDMPLVNNLLIRQLEEFMIDSDIVCYKKDYLFPFPGVYTKSILPSWKKEVAQGNKKMQHLIKQFKTKSLPIERTELFLNVNTPADIKKAEQLIK